MKQAYCGLEPFAAGFVGDTGLAVTGALFEVVGIVSALGATGTVVIALSGLSKRSLLGTKPESNQSARIRNSLVLPSIVGLIAPHGRFALGVPRTCRLST